MRKTLMGLAALALAAVPSQAQERMAGEGEITTLNPDMSTFSLRRSESGDAPDVRVLTDGSTRYRGVRSLEGLEIGRRVVVNADLDDESGTWTAREVALSPRQTEPVPPREDVITDDVIREDRSSLAPLPPEGTPPGPEPAGGEAAAEEDPPPAAETAPAEDTPPAGVEIPAAAQETSLPAPDGDAAPHPAAGDREPGDLPVADEPTDQNRTPH